MIVYLGVGSNLGDRAGNLDQARLCLERRGVKVLRESPRYENEALCRSGERMPPFLNAVIEIETALAPLALLNLLEETERSLGRFRKLDWSPRTIDLDILLYGSEVIDEARLKVPHAGMSGRWFVLKPLSDLAPRMIHPVLKKTICEMEEEL